MKLPVIVEWPRGTRVRWKKVGARFVRGLEAAPAPVNYGFVPGSQNPADGAEVDALLLGLPVPAGKRVEAVLVGILELADGDHKLVLDPKGEPPDAATREAILAWFEPERRPRLASAEAARTWLSGKL